MAERTNLVEDETLLSLIWFQWSSEVTYNKTVHYYTAKMDGKRQQLQQVQNMFHSFREQLEQGIGTTPRPWPGVIEPERRRPRALLRRRCLRLLRRRDGKRTSL